MLSWAVEGLRAEGKALGQLDLLARVAARPEVAGTSAIVLKGAGLVLSGILTRRLRSFVDVDLLVAEEDVPRWERAAAAAGAVFRPGGSHEYERGYVTSPGALLEIHVALPGRAGRGRGPSHAEVLARSVPLPCAPGLRTTAPTVSREIAVHHFLRHHSGEPVHALRVLQDLAALEGSSGEDGLEWGDAALAPAAVRLRAIARSLASGAPAADSDEFLARLFDLVRAVPGEILSFSDDVDRWLADRGQAGKNGMGAVFSRLFPPPGEMRLSEDEPSWRLAARYARRPFRLLTRYVTSAFGRTGERRRAGEWRRYLATG